MSEGRINLPGITQNPDRNSTAYSALLTRMNTLERELTGLTTLYSELRDRVQTLETATPNRGGRSAEIQKELDTIFDFLKQTRLKFNAVAVAQNVDIKRQVVHTRLEALRREGRIQFFKRENEQGVYYYQDKEEGLS